MTTFMTGSEKQLVDQSYMLVAGADKNADGQTYQSLYPKAGRADLCKKEVDETVGDGLDNAFGTATWTMINVLRGMAEQSGQSSPDGATADIKDLDIPCSISLGHARQSAGFRHCRRARKNAGQRRNHSEAKRDYARQGFLRGAWGGYKRPAERLYPQDRFIHAFDRAARGGRHHPGQSFVLEDRGRGRPNLRSDVFKKIESFSNNEFDKFGAASLITRCTNDVTQIQQLLMIGIRLICYAPIMGVGGIIMAVSKSASMSWVIAVACISLVGLILVIMAIAMPKFKTIQKLVDRLNLVSRENLSGMMVIRAFDTQAHEKKRFKAANEDLTGMNLFVNRVMVFMMPAMMLVMNGTTLLIVWVGANRSRTRPCRSAT
jgi:ATP-binding cassette subfamily B protein